MLEIYFDMNIYRMITQRSETRQLKGLLKSQNARVVASSVNLLETFAISNESERRAELETLVSVARVFEDRPESWYQAEEVRFGVRRHRPEWLRVVDFPKKARELLRAHSQRGEDARLGILPPAAAFAHYKRDFERGVAQASDFQKEVRQQKVRGLNQLILLHIQPDGAAGEQLDLENPEVFWRADCLLAWSEAIVSCAPSSRDYRDWLSPYLRVGAFETSSYSSFWLRDVGAEEVPKNRIPGLVGFYQLGQKISHGNASDQLHACHALDVDLFVTADRGFFEALRSARSHLPRGAQMLLVDRESPSLVASLQRMLA